MYPEGKATKFILIQLRWGATERYHQGEICRITIKSDSSAQDELLWQGFLCSLAQLYGDAGTKVWWWEQILEGEKVQEGNIDSYHSSGLLIRVNSEKHQQIVFCHCFYLLLFFKSASPTWIAQTIWSLLVGHTAREEWKWHWVSGEVIRKKAMNFNEDIEKQANQPRKINSINKRWWIHKL